ncbi:Anaerobic nitric oxide reductase flavorubredoxin [Desulfosporosinus sp. I2]|uniref:anaerobic nitric oxide reductase flavorubredoxin n=1 Tax=Desulfosporosinus sp. I2 TaxID=1617025 RepID=UPI0005EF9A6A|nr:anaerobic nitric oxide reductase flavorubredoxin [Desulfosporosinus sp. I2]KJR47671.1 Anaerobic nitric oxide reductase flavorubredoxin [Desulfosporosinus sp. I2]
MSFVINKSVTWVGKIDWELKKFHGDEYSTHRGSSYNSYLVRDEKIALIDCVWTPFAKEFVANLKKELDLNTIDYIIANHGEPDHSGALPELMKEIPNTPIYCTANAMKSLKGQYHQDWNFVPVKTGDKLSLGSKEFVFVEARMLHWPDTMFTYLTGDNILFSNDGFGQHLASEHMFNDLVDQAELYQEAIKYYANILTPFSKFVENKINEILSFDLPVDMICPSHGVIWRDNPLQIVHKYMEWAKDYKENQITIIYDTMWNSTRKMAEKIAAGIRLSDTDVTVKLFNCNSTHTDKNDIITEVFKSKAIIVGSPTINKGILFSAAGILEMIKGLGFKNKKGAAFGSYGWSGENTKLISAELEHGGFDLLNEGLKVTWNPDDDSLIKCQDFGRSIGEMLK